MINGGPYLPMLPIWRQECWIRVGSTSQTPNWTLYDAYISFVRRKVVCHNFLQHFQQIINGRKLLNSHHPKIGNCLTVTIKFGIRPKYIVGPQNLSSECF